MALLFAEDQRIPQQLRDYQTAAINGIRTAWDEGNHAPLIAVATGGGKTTIIAELLRQTIAPASQRALVVAHTEEIIHQIYERVANQFAGRLDDYYYADGNSVRGIGIVNGDNDLADARIVVATRQSLHDRRLARVLSYGAFDVLVIDEAHHAGPGTSYQDIIAQLCEANPRLKLAGVTATPARGDGHALESTFSSIVYQWRISDGIDAGYLVPVTRVKIKTAVSAEKVRTRRGDYTDGQLVNLLESANWLDLCVQAFAQQIAPSGRQTLAFLPSVEMSKAFAVRLRQDGINASHIDGETDKDRRRAILRDYKAGKLRVVSNMGVLTEGFDAPETAAIFLARPTKSQTLFTQIVGRGLRPFPGKTDCLLVDMTVEDMRALEVGTLLGKQRTCWNCQADYYFGFKVCPGCGELPQPGQTRSVKGSWTENFEGCGLIANFDQLFDKAFAAWYRGQDGWLTCTVSYEDGTYLIVPPLKDEYYRLIHVPKDKTKPLQPLDRNDDLAALMLVADGIVREQAARTAYKPAAWRDKPATLAQVTLLDQLGVKHDPLLSRGMAQQMITHKLIVKRFLRDAGVTK